MPTIALRRMLCMVALLAPTFACALEPLPTFNQSPLVQIYGLPAFDSARVLAHGEWQTRVTFEVTNNFVSREHDGESLSLDGEMHRTAVTIKYGGDRAEWGIEIPYLSHSGGFLDGFIENWHNFFGLPQNGRDAAPSDRLLYAYQRNGVDRLRITEASRGIGDVRLLAAWPLAWNEGVDIAWRNSLKLPTGDADELHGSGAADLASWLSFSCAPAACPGAWSWNATGGALILGRGDVLPDLQRRAAAFGGAGLGWRVAQPLTLKTELRFNSPLYHDTHLVPLNVTAVQLILGGTWHVYKKTALDVGVSEDIRVDTGPDVSILISLRTSF